MNNLQLLDRALASYEQMLEQPSEVAHFQHNQISRISNEIGQTDIMSYPREVALLSSMAVYGTWLGIRGVVKIGRGDSTGWDDIHLCFLYRAWKVRVQIASGDRVKRTKGLLLRDGIAESLGLAIVLGDWEYAQWCGDRVLKSFRTKEGAFTNDPYKTPFEPFLFELYRLWKRDPVDMPKYPGCDLGPYRDVLSWWNSTGKDFEFVLRKACDYHCDPSGFGGYANVPFVHIPVEILAIQIVRESLGLAVPSFSHPLLETPFAKVPRLARSSIDPMLAGAVARIRQSHPEIGDSW